jgi:hypothetical protein
LDSASKGFLLEKYFAFEGCCALPGGAPQTVSAQMSFGKMFLIARLSLKTNPWGKALCSNYVLSLSRSLAAPRRVDKTSGYFGFSREAVLDERVVVL